MIKKILYRCFILILLTMTAACSAPSAAPVEQASIASESIADIIDKYRQEIPQQMQQKNIPGLAIAVVDDQGILWEEGFGYTDWDQRTPVTPATLFSIQSMSKSFTATAAMFAAQEGLVDPDVPITTYLPDFHVQSIFEEHPEQKMTMRILLSHTAGFPHDPMYGGDADGPYGAPPYSFESHIASISDSWLMFPVGTRYSYSNIGIDLAGYILQVRAGMPFIQYVQKRILDPLGMKDSTLDYQKVRATLTRAIGHVSSPLRPPVDFQVLPSGGVWTSAEDMARYLQFHINKGSLDGNRILQEDLAETMYTPPNLPAFAAYLNSSYALGITVNAGNNTRHFQHSGGGFGFNASMVWYPDLKLGSVVLTNSDQSGDYFYQLSEDVLGSIMMTDIPLYHQRSISATRVPPAYSPDTDGEVLTTDGLRNLIASKALPEDTDPEKEAAKHRRSAAVGTYLSTFRGIPGETLVIGEKDGRLTWSYHGQMEISSSTTLTEVQPGLYFSTEGNLLDLRGPALMIDNVRLIKENPQVMVVRVTFYALFGMVFLFVVFFWPARAFLRRLPRKVAANTNEQGSQSPTSSWLVWARILAVLTSIFDLICLGLIAIAPNLIYIPWPHPFVDLTWWQFALISLPSACLILAVGVIVLTVLALHSSSRSRSSGWYSLVIGLILLAFNGMLLFR